MLFLLYDPCLGIFFSTLVVAKYQDRKLKKKEWQTIDAIANALEPVSGVLAKQQTRSSQFWSLADSTYSMGEVFVSLVKARENDEYWAERNIYEVESDEPIYHQIIELREEVRKRVIDVIKEAVRPLTTYIEEQAHLVLALALDPRYCTMKILKKVYFA